MTGLYDLRAHYNELHLLTTIDNRFSFFQYHSAPLLVAFEICRQDKGDGKIDLITLTHARSHSPVA